MEFARLVRQRRMVRNYDPDRPVSPEIVERLLAHAIRAPSAGFSQGWGFLVLAEPVDRERFWQAASPPEAGGRWYDGMRKAPLIIVPHSDKDAYLDRYAEPDKGWSDRDETRWPVPYWHIDTGMASLLILLSAVDEGLGGCFFGIPPEQLAAYRAAFGVPERMMPIGAVTIGYPAPDWRSPSLQRGRRGIETVAHQGRWGQPWPSAAPGGSVAAPGGSVASGG